MAYQYKKQSVGPGETLLGIAEQNKLPYQDLLNANPDIGGYVTTGQVINIPNAAPMPDFSNMPAASFMFGLNPPASNAQINAPVNAPPPQITPVNQNITAIGGVKYFAPGISSSLQNQSLIGVPGSSGSSASPYENYESYKTIQTQAEAQKTYSSDKTGGAYVSKAVKGNKWKVVTRKDANGNWVKLTVPDYGRGARKRRNKAAQRTYETPAQVQNTMFTQLNSWRLATG